MFRRMSGIQNSDVARTPAGEDPATKPLPQLLDVRNFREGGFQGIRLPYYKRDSDSSVQQQVEKLKEFKFKDGDVLLCAYPKSGKSSRLDGRGRGTESVTGFWILTSCQPHRSPLGDHTLSYIYIYICKCTFKNSNSQV